MSSRKATGRGLTPATVGPMAAPQLNAEGVRLANLIWPIVDRRPMNAMAVLLALESVWQRVVSEVDMADISEEERAKFWAEVESQFRERDAVVAARRS